MIHRSPKGDKPLADMNRDRSLASGPNERLKQARLLRNWTQAYVADSIGTDAYTVTRWERGRSRPSPHFREKLCELFETNVEELGLLPARSQEADLTPPDDEAPPLWLLPYLHNPYFTGREDILQTLHAQLAPSGSSALMQSLALTGLGGVGKTQVAVEYAYRYAREYSAIFWIEAETYATISASLRRVVMLLQLPGWQEEQQQSIETMQRWLLSHTRWLLIWDNVENLELVQGVLPPSRHGSNLITTRHQALGSLAQPINLLPLKQEEGLLFLLRRVEAMRREATVEQLDQLARDEPSEYAAAIELVKAMEGLPLALDQAGAYIEETRCTITDYLGHFARCRSQLLDRRGVSGGTHPHSVTATFLLVHEQAERGQNVMMDILHACAFLHAENIPEELFTTGAAYLGSTIEVLAADPTSFDRAIASLRRLSLVQRSSQARTLTLHRLVQVVLQEQMSEQKRILWLKRVRTALNALFPNGARGEWKLCERLLPHVLACVNVSSTELVDDEALAELLVKAADYVRERAQYEQAKKLYQHALQVAEHVFGEEHPEVTRAMSGLAILAHNEGDYGQAELLLQRALRIREQALGSEHPKVAATLSNLAIIYGEQGKYQQAEVLLQRALRIQEQSGGPEHPKVAFLCNLATAYAKQGRDEQAEIVLQRAQDIAEHTWGLEHPLVAEALWGLAEIERRRNQENRAEALYRRALSIVVQVWGKEHPMGAQILNGLAEIAARQGKDEQAERLYQQALYIQQQTLGYEHVDTAYTLNGLANLYARQGKQERAQTLYQGALLLREKRLDAFHPDLAQTLYDFARLSQQKGNVRTALLLAEHALQIRDHVLGSAHPQTVVTREFVARLAERIEPACASSTGQD